jgi:hypothetical protein
MKSSPGKPVRLVIYTSHHLQGGVRESDLRWGHEPEGGREMHEQSDMTNVSRALAACDNEREAVERDQSARFSRPATIERVLQELSVPSADTSYERSNAVVREGYAVPKVSSDPATQLLATSRDRN